MADDNIWGDIGKAIVAIAVAETLSYGLSQINQGNEKSPTAQSITSRVSSSPAYIMLGGYSKSAGLKVFDGVNGDRYGIIQAIHRGRINDYLRFYLNGDNVDIDGTGKVTAVYAGDTLYGDGRYVDDPNPSVNIQFRYGAVPETAYSLFTSNWPLRWTSAHRGDGISSISMILYGKGKNQAQAYPAGIPNLSVVARPGDIYDWRQDSTAGGTGTQRRNDPTTWGPSDNPVVNFIHLHWARWGYSWDRCIAPLLADLTTQANICDEAITLSAGGTEKRYTCAGWYIDTPDRNSIRNKLAASMDGWWCFDGRGRLVVKAGKYEAPTFTLTGQYIEEGSTWNRGVTRDQRKSGVTITYTDPNSDYNTNSPDAWVIAENGGQYAQLDLEWVTSWTQARRLAKRFASRANPAYTGQIRTGPNGFLGMGRRYIRLQNENEPSMADVVCEVTNVELDPSTGQFVFDVISADPNIDAWNPATEEGASPAILVREAADSLTTPTVQSVTPFYDGGNVRFKVVTTGPTRGDLTWAARWRVTGSTLWNEAVYADVSDLGSGQVMFNMGVVTVAPSIDVQTFYRTGSDSISPYSTTYTVNSSVVPPSWADPGALWQAELTSTSNRLWTGDTTYATLAAAVTATKASFARTGSKLAAAATGVYSSFSTGVIAMTDQGASLEPAETNLATRSDETSNIVWIAVGATKTAGQTTPFGSDGVLVTCDGTAANHYLRRDSITTVNAQPYTSEFRVKAGTATRLQIAFNGPFASTCYVNFLLSGGGSISAQGAGITGASVRLENGEYVLSATAVATSNSSVGQTYIIAISTGSETRLPTLTLSTTYYVDRVQIVQGTQVGTPIIATSSAATRNADALIIKPLPGIYTVKITYSDATVTTLTGVNITSSGYAVPTKLGAYVTKIVGS